MEARGDLIGQINAVQRFLPGSEGVQVMLAGLGRIEHLSLGLQSL